MSRKQKPTKHMSADELKKKLYAHFDKSGSLDQLKSELRGQLVTELLKVAAPTETSKTFPSVPDFEKCLLPLQVSNWLVYDHLLHQDYQYALSTFVSEARLPYPEKLLTAGDILGLFGLDSKSEEYRKISKMYSVENKDGFLHSLLTAVIKSLFDNTIKDTLIENREKNKEKDLLSEDRNEIAERDFSKDIPKNLNYDKPRTSVSEPLKPSYFGNYKTEVAESSFLEQLKSLKQGHEREVQDLRHKLLTELDNLHLQEHKMKLEVEQERNQLMTDRNQLFLEIQKLKEKELVLEKEYENKLQRKLKDFEEDFASKLHLKDKELETLQNKLSNKEERLHLLEVELTSQKAEYNILKKELEDSQHIYKTTHDKYISLLDENTNLLKKFEAMSDYSILKEDLSSKSKEIIELQKEIKQMQEKAETEKKKFEEALKNAQDKLRVKEPELLQTQRELNLTRESLHREETVWSKERGKLQQELHTSKELYRAVIQRIEEQKQDIQDLHRTIHILHYQLSNSTSSNLNNTSSNLLKSDFLGTFKTFSPTIEQQPKNLTSETLISKGYSPSNKKDSLKFIAESKDRIDKLQKQAEAIQDKYSFIFTTLQDSNKAGILTGSNSIFKANPISKSVVGNYDIPPSTLNSPSKLHHNHFSNFAKNRMLSLHTSNAYSDTHVKRLVTNSLFPSDYVSNNQHLPESGILHNLSKSLPLSSYKLGETAILQKNLDLSKSVLHSDVQTSAHTLPTYQSTQETTLNSEPFNNPIVSNLNTTDVIDSLSTLKYGVNSNSIESFSQSELKNKLNSFEETAANALNLKITNATASSLTLRQGSKDSYVRNVSALQTEYENKLNELGQTVTNVDEIEISTSKESNDNQPIFKTRIEGDKSTPVSEGSNTTDQTKEIMDSFVSSCIESKIATDENKSETEFNFSETQLHSIVTPSEIGISTTVVSDVGGTNTDFSQYKISESRLKVNPVVVDLDAVWKQKANDLPTISLYRKGSLLDSVNLLNSCKEISSDQKIVLHSEQKSETLNSENKSEKLSKQQCTQLKDDMNNPSASTRSQESFIDQKETENEQGELHNENSEENKTELEYKLPDRDTNLNNNNKMPTDTKVSKQEEKSNIHELQNASSLSELSEIHLSCGSDQEQQKYDSDNW